MTDLGVVVAWTGIGLITLGNVASIGYFAGRISARITTLAAAVTRLEDLHLSNPGQSNPPSIGPATRISGASDDPDT